jgi:hypothetical protein
MSGSAAASASPTFDVSGDGGQLALAGVLDIHTLAAQRIHSTSGLSRASPALSI